MIKYASNAFLATKISFINEIANLCEKVGANIEEVATGMGLDKRIGHQFLKAGIGYGGSCFPKDTNALVQLAGNNDHEFHLLKSVIEVNNHQRMLLVNKVKARFGDLKGKRIALLGLAFKPNTDDIRESPSVLIARTLLQEGAEVITYDPIAIQNTKRVLPEVHYQSSIEAAIREADAVLICTEWEQIKQFDLNRYKDLLREPLLFDGRNCYNLDEAEKAGLEYHSIGRPVVKSRIKKGGHRK
jgi:UDPglucose 6-dehydrogenase